MSVNQSLIDHVVARVLERLGQTQAQATHVAAQSSSAVTHFSGSVLTEQILSEQLNGSASISIDAGSIVTPSAKDFLRRQNITWTRSSASQSVSSVSTSGDQLILVDDPHSLASLVTAGWSINRVNSRCEAIAAAVESVVSQGGGTVIFAKAAEAVACEANRNSRIRAVSVCCVERLNKAKADLRPNVICIDPTGPGHFELRNLLKAAKGLVKD